MANEIIHTYDSATTVISLTADLADANIGGGTSSLNNSTLKYPLATATLYLPSGFLTIPDDRSTVDLYMVRLDTDGTSDDLSSPSGTDLEASKHVGSFLIHAGATAGAAQRDTIVISLAGVVQANYYIMNNAGQTIDYVATAITVKVLPFTWGT